MTARPPFMSAAPTPHSTSPSTARPTVGARGHGVEVAGQHQPLGPSELGAGHHVVAVAHHLQPRAGAEVGRHPVGQGRLVAADRRRGHQLGGEGQEVAHRAQAETPCSRSTAFSWDLSWRWPSFEPLDHQHARQEELAAGVLAPAGGRDRHRPGRHHPAADLDPGLGVDDRDGRVEDGPLPEHRPLPDPGPLGDHAAAADHGVVLDHDRGGVGRLEHPADAHPAREVDAGTDLGARADRGPGVDHGVGPHPGSDVHVAGHEHDPAPEERAPPGRAPGHHPDAGRGVVVLEGQLVGDTRTAPPRWSRWPGDGRAGGWPSSATRGRRPSPSGAHLGHPGLAPVEQARWPPRRSAGPRRRPGRAQRPGPRAPRSLLQVRPSWPDTTGGRRRLRSVPTASPSR